MARKKKDNITQELIKQADIDFINQMLSKSDIGDFAISKSTLTNIAGWALNGASDSEIRKNLDLDKHQWAILCTVCPTMLMIMQHSRAMADMVIAGSLFQTAIGGKRVKRQIPVKVKIYDQRGRVEREEYKVVEIEEELPPNPALLKFLAEHKLSDNFGDSKEDKTSKIKDLAANLSPEDKALIEMAIKNGEIDGIS